ncbi:MAG: hypothetical protein FJ265_23425, partial [Planctomycetes bacterium]|nr:hypothetical protein [Planctomycetota bacterium]
MTSCSLNDCAHGSGEFAGAIGAVGTGDAEFERSGSPRFRSLLVGHDPNGSPESTLVLAAWAAFGGRCANGDPMPGAVSVPSPTLRELARELGLHVGAVRRGVRGLLAAGALRDEADELVVVPEELARRWADARRRVRLPASVRQLGLRSEPLLLAALVFGQADGRGRLCLGIDFLAERLGLPRRTLQRALTTCRQAGAVHTWTVPPRWQMFLA